MRALWTPFSNFRGPFSRKGDQRYLTFQVARLRWSRLDNYRSRMFANGDMPCSLSLFMNGRKKNNSEAPQESAEFWILYFRK